MLQRNELTMGHVKPLLSLGTNLNLMVTIAKRAYSEQWSVRKVEDVIKMQQLSLNQKQNVNKKSDLHLVALENTLSRTLDTKVKINKKQLIINYSNHKELNRILEFLKLI